MSERSLPSSRLTTPVRRGTSGRGFGIADVLVLTTVVLWASSFSVIKSAFDEFTPLSFAAVRFILASLGMVLLLAVLRRPLLLRGRDLMLAAVLGIFHVGLYQILFSVGLKYTTASNSTLLISTSSIVTALLVWLTRAEPLSWRQVTGILLALTGVVLLVTAKASLSAGHLKGDLLTLGAAWSYGITPVLAFPLLQRKATLSVMTVGMVAGTFVILAAAVPDLLAQSWQVSGSAWAQMLFAALGAGTLGYLFWYEGIGRIGPTRVAAYSVLIPVLGILIAVTVLHESFTLRHVLGAAIALAGVALARWPSPAPRLTPGRQEDTGEIKQRKVQTAEQGGE